MLSRGVAIRQLEDYNFCKCAEACTKTQPQAKACMSAVAKSRLMSSRAKLIVYEFVMRNLANTKCELCIMSPTSSRNLAHFLLLQDSIEFHLHVETSLRYSVGNTGMQLH